ncbi:putative riboflavin import permease protein RfuC [Myxococcaceae bacterium]|nr:putative riboflavin import permease protein RfuC [Myxococcaceae bacterium]
MKERLRVLASPIAAALASIGIAVGVLLALGHAPLGALEALVRGAGGSPAAWTGTLQKSTPLLLTGLAVALSFRCGVWNIGAEGQLYAGALAATFVATRWLPADGGAWLVAPVLVAGALGGAGFGALAGWLRAARGVSEVISTILLNFVAIQLVAYAIQGPLQEAPRAYPQSDPLPHGAMLPALDRLHLGVPLALIAALVVAFLIDRTAVGFRLRAVGHAPEAARFAGLSPERLGTLALALAGGLAGLAGAVELAGMTGRLYEGLSPGPGYTAIAVALLARLAPLAVIPSALFFGALANGALAMQREAAIPSVATQVVQGIVILLSVGFALGRLSLARERVPSEGEA